MEDRNGEIHVNETEASGGSKEGVVRWVLIVGLVLVIGLLSVTWITGAWTTLWTELPMGIDTGSSTKTNPALWDQLFIHMEGAGNKADNLRLEKIVAL